MHGLVLLLQGCKSMASLQGYTGINERKQAGSIQLQKAGCKGEGFKL